MSSYGYGPPPPPPPAAASGGLPSYGHPAAPYPQHNQQRGGGPHHGRGRGAHYIGGRPEYQSSPPAHYEYTGQQYAPQNPAPYGGPHLPAAGSYPPPQPQWPTEHAHHPPHGSVPVPMPSNSYQPNYPPQQYPPSQYPQQPPYGAPQQYANPYQGPPPPSQPQWSGQVPQQPPPYGNGRPRGYIDRGGPKPPMAGPMRPVYEHEAMPPPVNGSYGQPYPQDPRVPHYPPSQYPSYPGPPQPPAPRQDGYYGQVAHRGGSRGRGGGSGGGGGYRDGNSRGRGGHQAGDKNRHQKPSHHDSAPKHEPPSVGKKKKRKMNTLGLTPGMESESEDDEDDERYLTELIGKEALSVNDVDAFLKERKNRYPTAARVNAKKRENAELANHGEDKASSLEKQADRLRRQLRKVESSIKRKREQGDEGDEMRGPSEETSDDEKPEVMSTRSHVAPPPPPAKKADVSRHCKYYSTGGTCGKKGKCRFVHDPEVREAAMKDREANNGRLTIKQRLILNDKEQQDLTVLQSINYLREKGLMTRSETPENNGEGHTEIDTVPPPRPASSLLPAASASLPPMPIKRETGLPRRHPPSSTIPSANNSNPQGMRHYEGWLLQPYGSSNGKQSKSDDLP
ncbi:hypothetical protein G7046_g74 [Stylonectria norvegica]|nr:hypothetical protein G7046_g74 [Stylonectria norvegica]